MFKPKKADAAGAKDLAGTGKRKTNAKKKTLRRSGKTLLKNGVGLRKRNAGPRVDLGIGPADIVPGPGIPRSAGQVAVEAAIEKKATDVLWLDVRGLSSLCDEMVLATARSVPHLQAVGDFVEEALRKHGERVLHRDGLRGAEPDWLLLDFGDLLVHLFRPEARENYQLETFYAQARVLGRWKNT
jgi:ribosome-associated protein